MYRFFMSAVLFSLLATNTMAGENLLGNSSFMLGEPVVKSTPDGQKLLGSALNLANWETEGPFKIFNEGGEGVNSLWCNSIWSSVKWLSPGPYSFSVWLKTDGQERQVKISVAGNGRKRKPVFELIVKASGEWKRYNINGQIQAPGRYVCTITKTAGEMAVNRPQLERGALTDYKPMAPVEGLVKAVDNVNRMYLPGEEINLEAELANQTTKQQTAMVDFTRQNLYLDNLGTESKTVVLAPYEKKTIPLKYKVFTPGAYRILMKIGSDGLSSLTGMTYMAVPPPRNPDSIDMQPLFFGVDSSINAANIEYAKKMGAKWWRTCGMNNNVEISSWCFVEPEKGKYVWRDDLVDLLLKNKFNIMANHLRTPGWASSAPAHAVEKWGFKPKDFNDWRDFLEAFTTHFKGRIACHEIWNEAAGSFFNGGTPEEFVQFTQIAIDVIRKNDHGSWIMGGANSIPSFSMNWTKVMLDSAIYKQLDYFDAHEGQVDKPFMDGLFASGIKQGRIWLTETNPGDISFHPLSEYDPNRPFNPLLRFNLAAIGALTAFSKDFCGRSYYYISNNFVMGMARMDYEDIPLRDFDGAPTPYTLGAAVLAQKLHHLRWQEKLKSPEGVTAQLFGNTERCLIAVWAPYDQNMAEIIMAQLPEDVNVTDLTGNPVKQGTDGACSLKTPLFLECSPTQTSNLKSLLAKAKTAHILPPVLTNKLATMSGSRPEVLKRASLVKTGQVCRGMPYFIFSAPDMNYAVFWQEEFNNPLLTKNIPEGLEIQGWFGQKLKLSSEKIVLPLPIPYLVSFPGKPEELAAWFAGIQIEGLPTLKLENPRFSRQALTVSIVNNEGQPVSGELSLTSAPEGLLFSKTAVAFGPVEPAGILFQTVAAGTSSFTEELEAPGSTLVNLPMKEFPAQGTDTIPLSFKTVTEKNRANEFKFNLKTLRSFRTAKQKKIDGDLADWTLNSPGLIGSCTSSTRQYRGGDDCSGTVFSTWDELNLYLAVKVKDDHFFRAYRAAALWQSDCVEFFFNACPERTYPVKPRNTDIFFHLFLGPAGNNLPDEVCVESGGQFMKAEKITMVSSRTADGYTIECSIPFAAFQYLGGRLESYTVLGFDAAINDNDKGIGEGDGGNQTRRETIVNWAGSPDNYRDVSKYGSLILMPQQE